LTALRFQFWDDVEENLQNQMHNVVKETICIRLASIEKISPCQGRPPKKLLPVLSNIVEASKAAAVLALHRSNHQAKTNVLNKLTASDFCHTYKYE
jgi:hypothetical protein